MLQTGVSDRVRSNGSLKVEWAVRPPSNSVAAIPEEATARAMPFEDRIFANNRLITRQSETANLRHLT